MPTVIFNAILPILGMILASNFCSAFGFAAAPEFAIAAAVSASVMNLPMASSTLSFLVVAAAADLNASGPPGLVSFLLVILYLLLRMITQNAQPQRFLGMAALALTATFILHAAQAGIYTLYYPDAPFWTLFLKRSWISALETALLTPIVVWLVNRIGSLFEKKKTGII